MQCSPLSCNTQHEFIPGTGLYTSRTRADLGHHAQGLLAGDTVAGLAGGVNALMLPITMCTICGLSALSPQARCMTFDAAADGYGRGEAFAGAHWLLTKHPA